MPETYFALVRREPKLVAFWRQNDQGSSSDMADYASRYDLFGLYTGRNLGPALIQSDSGAASSSLASGYGQVGDAAPLHITGDISIEAWVFAPTSATGSIIAKQNSGATFAAPYSLQVSSGTFKFSLGDGTSQTSLQGGSLAAGVPTHVVATSFRGELALYIDGAPVGSGSLGAQSVSDGGEPLRIGSTSALAGVPLAAEVALYNGALSARRIARHFTIGQQVLADPAHRWLVDPPVVA